MLTPKHKLYYIHRNREHLSRQWLAVCQDQLDRVTSLSGYIVSKSPISWEKFLMLRSVHGVTAWTCKECRPACCLQFARH